ncbi:hypothetical protein EV645_5009 [Kribbella rubisoli]|uniref:Uncharacterized protein n=1 Tax=Kribbella rubisoli TaxID=3075929 RepID=A0A4Q7WWN6_9ACTN|nr:hypothetical protein EV645_5009 [Kribbella rubisoli]
MLRVTWIPRWKQIGRIQLPPGKAGNGVNSSREALYYDQLVGE